MSVDPSLADFTMPALIRPDLRGGEVPSVLHELCDLLHREGRVPELLPFYHAALNREFLSSSAMESGMAFPHARPAGLARLTFALGRSSRPLTWGPRGLVPVTLVFLLAVPPGDSGDYLRLLGALTRLGRSPAWLDQVRAAPDAESLHAILARVSLKTISSAGPAPSAGPFSPAR
jgi:mannitol/fructose-specific phosphotransferase system IIA component (Ntr-type)